MFYTSVIPSGTLTKVVKERYINDFETKYASYLKRKVKGDSISLRNESPSSTTSLAANGRVELLTDKLDVRVAKYIEFWVKGSGSFSVEIIDAFGGKYAENFTAQSEWKKFTIKQKEIKDIDLRYISKLAFDFEGDKEFLLDDVKLVYRFPTFAQLRERTKGRYVLTVHTEQFDRLCNSCSRQSDLFYDGRLCLC